MVAFGTAQASAIGTTIVCSAAKVRSEPEDNATALGIAYEGDKIEYDQFAYKQSEQTWYTRGTVTRQDGQQIRGYVPYDCANPYQDPTDPPTPRIPK
jgi:hypothetical protein